MCVCCVESRLFLLHLYQGVVGVVSMRPIRFWVLSDSTSVWLERYGLRGPRHDDDIWWMHGWPTQLANAH